MNAMNSSSVAQDIDLSDDQVARYLRENPNFFPNVLSCCKI